MRMYRSFVGAGFLLAAAFAMPAQGSVVGHASAFGLSADAQIVHQVTFLNVGVTAQLAPVPQVSGTAPAPFDVMDSAASAGVNAGALTLLGQGVIGAQSGLLNVEAQSNVGAPAGPPWFAEGSASVSSFSSDSTLVGTVALVNLANVFSFDGSGMVFSSEARAEGDVGSFSAFGDSRILDASGASAGTLTFTVLGVDHDVTLDGQGRVPPNTMLSISGVSGTSVGGLLSANLVGTITIHLNEQIETGDGISEAGMTVNAMRIVFDNVGAQFINALGLTVDSTNLLTGEIIVAQSHARLIPEPGSLGLLAAAGMLLARRSRRARLS